MEEAFVTVRAGPGMEGVKADMSEQTVIVMSALAKMFVGDLVHGGEHRVATAA